MIYVILLGCGGEGGIRTPGTRKRTIDFESTALDHSATSPKQILNNVRTVYNDVKKYCKDLINADSVLCNR